MIVFILLIIFLIQIFLWSVLIQLGKMKTSEEQYIEDNLQMEYLKKYNIICKK